MSVIWLVELGTIPYTDALALQHRIVEARKRGALNDTLLLLEHPAVFTLGRNARDSNVLASSEFLQQTGIQVYRVERGGDVTYHGPNQLVGYPILDLHNFRQDVGWFVRSIEEMLIRALGDFSIRAWRIDKLVGVWVANPAGERGIVDPAGERGIVDPAGERGIVDPAADGNNPSGDIPLPISREAKIAQIGARIENWITYHGFALNVDPNLAHFDLIVPCGISDKAVTSMARILNHPVDPAAVRERVAARFAEVFGAELVPVPPEEFGARLQQVESVGA